MMSVAREAIGVSSAPSTAVVRALSRSRSSAWWTSVVVPDRLIATTRSYVRTTGGSSDAMTASVCPCPRCSRSQAYPAAT